MLCVDETRTISPRDAAIRQRIRPTEESDRTHGNRCRSLSCADVRQIPDEMDDSLDQTIKELIARRKQLLDIHAGERHRAARSASPQVLQSIKAVLAFIEERVMETEQFLEILIREEPTWSEKDQLLQTVPGIDSILAKQLLIELPELGNLAGRQIASYVGVAPLGRNGDAAKGGQRARGGNSVVRSVLYAATAAVMQYDPKMSSFYCRLRAGGKPENVTIMACMRKMLVILNTIIKGRRVYETGREATQASV